MLKVLTHDQLRVVMQLSERYRGRDRAGNFVTREAVYVEDLANPHKRALFGSIKKLTAQARSELIALMWVGTGVYQAAEWTTAYRYARANQSDAELVYAIENGPLHEHLARGLERLGASINDAG